ncbi:uncharacterized protein LOC143452788 [Clavelina lepadiformis]|uniref:uncharacterized protein LOC143452788 n=1 Tax=Clavelina lepadiformis TaxID=159417 RepID=UPI0040417A62
MTQKKKKKSQLGNQGNQSQAIQKKITPTLNAKNNENQGAAQSSFASKSGGMLYQRESEKSIKQTALFAIYKCKREDGILVAEKYLLERHFQDAKACLREIENFKEICKKRSYPDNVVLYYGTEEKGDFVSIYMELCDGDLEQWAKSGLPKCKLTSLEICKQATEGIHYLHTKCNMSKCLKFVRVSVCGND